MLAQVPVQVEGWAETVRYASSHLSRIMTVLYVELHLGRGPWPRAVLVWLEPAPWERAAHKRPGAESKLDKTNFSLSKKKVFFGMFFYKNKSCAFLKG